MATTYTANDQINRALRLLGVLAEGETPSASTSQDALMALTQMLDSWDSERLSIYATQEQVVTWTSGHVSDTLGPSGTLGVLNRPVDMLDATFFKDPGTGISFPIQIINQEQYNAISLKTIQSTYPQVLFYNPTEPNGTVYLYPVPSTTLEFHFVSAQELTAPPTLSSVLAFPDGYLRAFVYNLACEIAPEFGVEPSPTVARIAVQAKRDIKNINDPEDMMSMPSVLISNRGLFNIKADY